MTSYSKTPTADLLKMLEHHLSCAEANIEDAAKVLVELNRRGERHPAMKEGVLRWFAAIADGTLTPKAAMTFAGVGTIIRKLIGTDAAFQNRMAMGEKLVVAVHDAEGQIVATERTILQLTTRQLDLVFGDKGLRDFKAQKRVLAARSDKKDVRRSSVAVVIRADIETGELVCGQMRFKPSELSTALKQLGFQITRVPKKAAA